MRSAKANDYWRAIERNRGWKVHIERVDYTNVNGIGTGVLKFNSPLNFICGPNGVGKTTLLRAISAILEPGDAILSPSTRFRLSRGQASMVITVGENTETIQIDFSALDSAKDWSDEIEVFHIDTSSVISELQNYFCDFPDIEDALNGVPVLEASADNLDTLRFLTNIPYASARVFTVEETEFETGVDAPAERPFFEVRVGMVTYDSRAMGLGELAAFYLWWSLERISDRSILLIEEPESFLSPMCQTAFADVLAQYSATKKPFVIVTTHSPQIIQSAPKPCLRFVYKDTGNSKINEGDPLEILLKTVGIEAKVRAIVMVEDNSARIFAKLMINQFEPSNISGIEFLIMEGHGNVVRALKAFPENPKCISLVGLLDGDAEAQGFAADRIAFLPGGKPIEKLYREMVDAELDRIVPILGIENLPQILYPIQGLELHEWFEHLRTNTNLSNEQLHFILFRAWIQKEENRQLAERYYGQLRSKLPFD